MTDPSARLPAYGKILYLGHRGVTGILQGSVTVQEKTDGSQLSFGAEAGTLIARSRSVPIDVEAPPKLFEPAIEHLKSKVASMPEGFVFRGEAICKPRHNTLNYDRTPAGFVVLFDVETAAGQHFAGKAELEAWAADLGLEPVPFLHKGEADALFLESLLDRVSVLGGQKIEGVVIKNYDRFGIDGKCLMAKLVRADFKEKNEKAWGEANPKRADIVAGIIEGLRTIPRWRKAVEHLRDQGLLQGEPRDIASLLVELEKDVEEEEGEAIRETLYRRAKGEIMRGVKRGFAEWYKEELVRENDLAFVPRFLGEKELEP